MSSPSVDRKPPAATTGSPGTAIFSPPSLQSTPRPARYSNESSTSTTPLIKSSAPIRSDPIPIQWSFESSYGIFNSLGSSSNASSRDSPRREPKTPGVLGGTWFGMRKDRHSSKPKPDRSKSVDASATRVPRSAPRPNGVASTQVTPPQTPDALVDPPPMGNAGPTTHPLTFSLSTSSPHITSTSELTDLFPHPAIGYVPLHRSTSSPCPDFTPMPLLTIPASNSPTPHQSRASTPIISSSHPPPSFRPTPSRRPESSAGIGSSPPTKSAGYISGGQSHLRRRPATSSGVLPSQSTALAPEGFDPANESNASLVSSRAPSTLKSMSSAATIFAPRAKETTAEAVKRKTEEALQRGFKMKNGKRHHPMSKEEAPYPRDYERKTTDHDGWETIFGMQLVKRTTFHSFDTPPTKVLDIGCGTGHWILNCAQEWKDTHFVGLDLVPIQPNLTRLGDPALASRVNWVLGNFLEPFPFADGEFDFVHVRRVARGVPEDRWDPFFEEVTRVLKVGGAFEMIEEDLFFPGSVVVGDDGYEIVNEENVDEHQSAESESEEERRDTMVTHSPPRPIGLENAALLDPLVSKPSLGAAHQNGVKTTLPVVQLPADTMDSFFSMHDDDVFATKDHSETRRGLTTERWDMVGTGDLRSDVSTSLMMSPPDTTNPTPQYARPTISTAASRSVASQYAFERLARSQEQGSQAWALSGGAPLSHGHYSGLAHDSLDSWRALGSTVADVLSRAAGTEEDVSGTDGLYHAHAAPVTNPRNHSVLEMAYNELHAARFINLTPLSMLDSVLVVHFKDVRSHPPMHVTYPDLPTSTAKSGQKQVDAESSKLKPPVSSSTPLPSPPSSSPSIASHLVASSSSMLPNTTNLVLMVNVPSLDMFQSLRMARPQDEKTGFPNNRMNLDMGITHMQLAARVAEILACAEEMWEFIEKCKGNPARWRSPAIGALAELSREEWDECLSRYNMDMQDRIGMGNLVRGQLGWGKRKMPRSVERKVFDQAVMKWDKFCRLREEQAPAATKNRKPTNTQPLSRTFRAFVAWK